MRKAWVFSVLLILLSVTILPFIQGVSAQTPSPLDNVEPAQKQDDWVVRTNPDGTKQCIQIPGRKDGYPSQEACNNFIGLRTAYVIVDGECIAMINATTAGQYETLAGCQAALKNGTGGNPATLPPPDQSTICPHWSNFYTIPCRVNTSLSNISVVFPNVSFNQSVSIPLFCFSSVQKLCNLATVTKDTLSVYNNDAVKFKKIDDNKTTVYFSKNICADGPDRLKVNCKNAGTANGDYFSAGKTYRVTMYIAPIKQADYLKIALTPFGIAADDKTKAALEDIIKHPSSTAPFYVNHFLPYVINPIVYNPSIANIPTIELTNSAGDIQKLLKVSLQGRQAGKERFNDYFVSFIGPNQDTNPDDIETETDDRQSLSSHCLFIPPTDTGVVNLKTPTLKDGKLLDGNYYLRISDGKNAHLLVSTPLVSQCQKGDEPSAACVKAITDKGNPNEFFNNGSYTCDDNSEEFVYYHIPITVHEGKILVGTPIADPYLKENASKYPKNKAQQVCPDSDKDSNGNCKKIATGLGIKVSTDPRGFISDLFTIILSISGIIVIVIFIQAGYTLMNSAGNKEKVGHAREQITAAIVGLIFLILSMAILEFIGVDILHLPGFTN